MRNLNLKKNAWAVFLALVTLTNVCLAAWPKTILDTTPGLVDMNGFYILSSYGHPLPALPAEFRPTAMSGPSGVHVLFLEHSQILDPPTIDEDGFFIIADNFQLQVATLADGSDDPYETVVEKDGAGMFYRVIEIVD